jgi:hypothetical protein
MVLFNFTCHMYVLVVRLQQVPYNYGAPNSKLSANWGASRPLHDLVGRIVTQKWKTWGPCIRDRLSVLFGRGQYKEWVSRDHGNLPLAANVFDFS